MIGSDGGGAVGGAVGGVLCATAGSMIIIALMILFALRK